MLLVVHDTRCDTYTQPPIFDSATKKTTVDDDRMVSGSAHLLTQEQIQEAIAVSSLKGGLTPDAARLFRIYQTINNMLYTRGYMVPTDFDDFLQFALVSQPARDTITILVEKADLGESENSQPFSLKMRRWVSSLSKIYTDRM
jgi:negative regulator of sigma E activity